MRITHLAAVTVVIAAVVAGCKSDHTGGRSRGSNAPADPWLAKPGGKPHAESPAERATRAKVALSRVAEIMPKLAALRGLTFDHDIPREYQTSADFKNFVHAEIAKELPPDKAADTSTALFQLGLLKKPANLADLEEEAFVTQAGAYYDPKQKKFFLVMVPDSDMMLDTTSAHELTHGLQDQHFDLQKYVPDDDGSAGSGAGAGAPKLDADAAEARHFVVEGDATFTMFLYTTLQLTKAKAIDPQLVAMLQGQLEKFAQMSPEELAKMNAPGAMSNDPDIKKSIEAMADIPATVLVPMIDSYMAGAVLVMTAYQRGGWPAVNDLFVHPPESTEQALHPATKLYPVPDPPRHVALPRLATGDTELSKNTFGELQWQVYFSLWVPAQKAIASEGWGGDQAQVVRRADGRLVARIATAWDSPKDATEFAQAYAQSLVARFGDGHGDPASPAGFARPDGKGKIFMQTQDDKVFAIDGVDDRKELAALIAGTKIP